MINMVKLERWLCDEEKYMNTLGWRSIFSKPGKFIMDMEQYIDEVMKDLPKEFGGMAATPAAEYMFKTRYDNGYLDQETAELFHIWDELFNLPVTKADTIC